MEDLEKNKKDEGDKSMNRSESIGALAAALSKCQGEMEGAKKDSENPFFKSSYADLASVWDACRGPLTKNGLSVAQTTNTSEGENKGVVVETIMMHTSGEWISGTLFMPCSKMDAQSFGSALTYARRYALQAMVGIAPVDDDANGAMPKDNPASGMDKDRPNSKPQPASAQPATTPADGPKTMSDPQRKKLWALMKEAKLEAEDCKSLFAHVSPVTSRDASAFIENFDARLEEWRINREMPEPGSLG